MEITARKSLYMRGLQAAYSGVLEIVEHVFHTAVYRYFPDEQRWERMEMEGSAYITRNYSSPLYSFIVLNKKGPADLILHIEENIEQINIQGSYLMMRCTNDMGKVTLGFWLREEDDRVRLYQALTRLKGSRRGSPVDMSHMLNKLMSAANKGVSPVSESNKAAAQLLSLLKQPDTTTVEAEEFPSLATSASAAPTKSSALLSLLRSGPSPLLSGQSSTVEENTQLPPLAMTYNNSQKNNNSEAANKLLSLIKSPPRPAAAAADNGTDLLTDGDIAAKVRTRAVSEGASSSSSSSTVQNAAAVVVATTNSGAAASLKAALFVGNSSSGTSSSVKQGQVRAQSAQTAAVNATVAEEKKSPSVAAAAVIVEQGTAASSKVQVRTAPTTPVLSAVSSASSNESPWAAMNALPAAANKASSLSVLGNTTTTSASSGKVRQQVKLISPSDLEAY